MEVKLQIYQIIKNKINLNNENEKKQKSYSESSPSGSGVINSSAYQENKQKRRYSN